LSRAQQNIKDVDVRTLDSTREGSFTDKIAASSQAMAWLARNRAWLDGAIAHVHVARGPSFYRKALLIRTARKMGAKIVLHLHGTHTPEWYAARSAPVQSWIRRQLDGADALVSVNESWLPFYRDLTTSPIRCIHNGVDLCAFEGTRPTTGQQDGPARVLYLGRIDDAKGSYHLLEAIRQLQQDEGPGLSLCMTGNGEVERARAWARERGIEELVTVTGWLEPREVRAQLDSADMLVLPSVASESFGLVLIEAMAACLPVVATRVGGIPEIVEDEHCGILVNPSDPAGLARAIGRLAANPELREQMGTRGRRRVEERFDIQDMAQRTRDLYSELLQP